MTTAGGGLDGQFPSSGFDQLLVFRIIETRPRAGGEVLGQETEAPVWVTLANPKDQLQKFGPRSRKVIVSPTPILDPDVLTTEAHVYERRLDESLAVDLIDAHRRFLSREDSDHLDELAEA